MQWFENKIFESDNLELIKKLPDNSIDLIYCDILYGTGRTFNDYKDLPAKRDVIEKFYIPRITEMHRVLKTNGSIYLQMDTIINHWIRCILDDIFGYSNFRNEITWLRSVGMNQKYNYFTKNSDKILFYTKTDNYTFNLQFTDHNSQQRYNKTDEQGRKYMICNIMSKKNFRYDNDFREFNSKKYYAKNGMGFALSQKTIEERIKSGFIFEENSQGFLGYRQYLDNSEGVRLSEIWTDIKQSSMLKSEYDTQKPYELLARIIKCSTNENDLVADFFCGSGVTLKVANELNRKFLGCDINPKAISISQNGIKKTTNLFSSNYLNEVRFS